MSDPLFDNVKELLDKEKGDERILKQILRACQNNEVISNYERNYVKKLAEKYLEKKSIEEKTSIEKPNTPDVVLPTPSIQKSMTFQTESSKTTKSQSKNAKLMLGIGGLALVVVIVAFMSGGISDIPANPDVTNPIATSQPISSFSVDTDLNSYEEKDIISIQGRSENDFVNLSIENQNGILVWSEQVKTKNDGRFSTLTIAGGTGWEKSGTFTLKAQDDSETKLKTFTFST